jgi:hypothetical protein
VPQQTYPINTKCITVLEYKNDLLNRCLKAYYQKTPSIDEGDDDGIGVLEDDISRRLVNGGMDVITEIIWPLFRRAQLYDQDISVVKIDFGESSVYQIYATTVIFPANFIFGTAERHLLQ